MTARSMTVAIVWNQAPESAAVRVRDGELGALTVAGRAAPATEQPVRFPPGGPARLQAECRNARLGPGSPATVLSVDTPSGSFSFFARDVTDACPIVLPDIGAAVIPAGDPRVYKQVAEDVARRNRLTKLQRIELEPEETYARAVAHTRPLPGRATLGLGRDIRLFDVYCASPRESCTEITPLLARQKLAASEAPNAWLGYTVTVSRGIGCALPLARRLEDGALPILHQRVTDDELLYDMTFFCSLETGPLAPGAVRGTHFLVADGHSGGHRFAPEHEREFLERLAEDTSRDAEETWTALHGVRPFAGPLTDDDRARFMRAWARAARREEEPVLVCRVNAVNTADVPRYAWLAAPAPMVPKMAAPSGGLHGYEPDTGFGVCVSGHIFCVARLNGRPFPNAELPVLLPPGGSVEAEFWIPHRPIPRARAERLAGQSAPSHQAACRAYWRGVLDQDAHIEVPECRIQDGLQACRLHLDMVMYGREPDGVLLPSCGRAYTALAPESAAMIQFLDSTGRHDLVRRALEYFLEKQKPDGMIQNFNGHQSEPGVVLQLFAEHFRITRDADWLRARAARLLKTAECLLEWRARNLRDELRGKGYGLIDGRWADMAETYRGFGINAIACRGVLALADALDGILPEPAGRIRREGGRWKQDLVDAVTRSMERAPVVPLGDGTWTPSLACWPESDLPACLDGTRAFDTHGTFLTRDNAMPSALIFHGLFEPDDPRAGRLLRYVTDLYHVRNVRHSQPYISWHPWVHLRRGEVKAFLKSYYNTLASLADREIFTFREHYHAGCPFKVEADGAFLMQTRWMLWLEAGDTLTFLAGVPRAWLADGRTIRLERVASYFGPLSLEVVSRAGARTLEAAYRFAEDRRPAVLRLRLPHPDGRRPVRVEGGQYEPASETAVIRNPPASGQVAAAY